MPFSRGKMFPDFVVALLPNSEAGKLPGSDKTKVEAIIEIMAVVSDLIREVRDLRFQGRRGSFVSSTLGVRVIKARMFSKTFAHFPGEIQSGKTRVPLFEAFDNSQGVQVVVEAFAEPLHFGVQRLLPGVSEWWVPDVVSQRQSFGEILVQFQDVG